MLDLIGDILLAGLIFIIALRLLEKVVLFLAKP